MTPGGALRSRRVGAVAVAMVLSLCIACSRSEVVPSASVTTLITPEIVAAGSVIEVVIEGTGPGDVELDVIDGFAVTTYVAPLNDGRATISLPLSLGSTSGAVTFRARGVAGNDSISATTEILPRAEATAVDIQAGPRTIVADGADLTMVTAIAADEFGNPLADGATVTIGVVSGSDDALDVEARVDHGVASRLISSDTSAGTVEVFATADGGCPVVASGSTRWPVLRPMSACRRRRPRCWWPTGVS